MRLLCSDMFAVWCTLTAAYLSYALSDEMNDMNDPPCYKADRKLCPTDGSLCGLETKQNNPTSQMYCCNVTHFEQIREFLLIHSHEPRPVTALHIRDSNFTYLNLDDFDRMRELTSLSITNSTISLVGRGFREPHPMLSCLEISGNNLAEFRTLNILTRLTGLKKLVLASNMNMTIGLPPDQIANPSDRIEKGGHCQQYVHDQHFLMLPHLPPTRSLIELDVSDNCFLECKYLINITEYVFHGMIQISQLKKNSTSCVPPGGTFFNNVRYVHMSQIDQVAEIFRYCPTGEELNCTCMVASLEDMGGTDIAYHASVNCSGRQLTSLPKILPPFTRILDVSNNSITSLEGICNTTYNKIKTLYADNNNITSLKPLEGTMFLENFQNLSLTNNLIDDIPRHIFGNVFDRSPGGKTVLLARNTLKCTCETATDLKTWLRNAKERIPDSRDIFADCDGGHKRVLDMNLKDYCPSNELQHYLRYVVFAEVTVFVLLIAKVSYDYYVFKTAGYLPWPASKMPKLPCDWCFET